MHNPEVRATCIRSDLSINEVTAEDGGPGEIVYGNEKARKDFQE